LKPAELRSIRRRLGLTQQQMAAKLGLSRTSYGAYENGRRTVRIVVALAARWLEEHPDRRR
jgi:DNA-binding XRE family transcriptional regulator